ncbi:MAG: hypothetical protein ACE5JU_24360 [Candidatus Binatia bacterium]
MPTRAEYLQVIEPILEQHSTSSDQAWDGIYRLLLWYDGGYPHIVEANELKKKSWGERARLIEAELAKAFGCPAHEVRYQVGKLYQHPLFRRMQIQNPLGIGFTLSVALLLRKFCSAHYQFLMEEAIGETVFIGLRDAPRRASDLVAVRGGTEEAIVSAKWSIRHDRLKDLFDECSYFRAVRPKLRFLVVTDEYMPARLEKLLENRCIDEVFHVRRDFLLQVNPGSRVEAICDLSALFPVFR